MSMISKLTMPAKSFRRIENPFEKDGKRMFLAVIQAKDLPKELGDWRKINPRDPKTTSGVAKMIASTLQEQPESFFFKNRGITLLAQHVSFDNERCELAVEFSDENMHGLLDGGHTFAVIQDAFDSLTEEELSETAMNRAYVKVEILEGFSSKEEATEIVGARNTSTQVKEQSLANLLRHFDSIKDILKDKPYADRIAYKEIELNDEGGKKDIDIKEVLSYLICFDSENFNTDERQPVIAYSSKGAVLKYAEDNRERLQKYLPLLPDILALKDTVYEKMPGAWNQKGGKFGGIGGVDLKKHKTVELPFRDVKSEYAIPSSFIYPVLASFRALVKVEGGVCSWKTDPLAFFEDKKIELVGRLVEQAIAFGNPNKLGKEKTVWRSCYDYVMMEVLKAGL